MKIEQTRKHTAQRKKTNELNLQLRQHIAHILSCRTMVAALMRQHHVHAQHPRPARRERRLVPAPDQVLPVQHAGVRASFRNGAADSGAYSRTNERCGRLRGW